MFNGYALTQMNQLGKLSIAWSFKLQRQTPGFQGAQPSSTAGEQAHPRLLQTPSQIHRYLLPESYCIGLTLLV